MLGTQNGTIILTTTQVEDGVSAPLQKAEDGCFACTLHYSFNWRYHPGVTCCVRDDAPLPLRGIDVAPDRSEGFRFQGVGFRVQGTSLQLKQ